jgi:predicted SpoU family rRNA methylase
MQTVVEKNVLRPESYVVEIDGKIRSAYGIFVEALKAGLELKQKFPHSRIKVHDAEYGRIEN